MKKHLALFDLDNTLLSGDSDYEWGQFLIDLGVLDRAAYEEQNRMYFEQYQNGSLDIHEYLGFALGPLTAHSRNELVRWRIEFLETRIRPMVLESARELTKKHLDAGDLCAIVTATNSFVTEPIAREFGVPNLIATEPEVIDGRFTGRVRGTPCFREGKVLRVRTWLEELGYQISDFPVSTFYSDSHNDLPLLKMVDSPVAVDPDDTLKAHAIAEGWPWMSFRDSKDLDDHLLRIQTRG